VCVGLRKNIAGSHFNDARVSNNSEQNAKGAGLTKKDEKRSRKRGRKSQRKPRQEESDERRRRRI